MMEKVSKYGSKLLEILKKVRNLHVIMVLITMKITNKLFVSANQKTAVVLLLEQSQDGV